MQQNPEQIAAARDIMACESLQGAVALLAAYEERIQASKITLEEHLLLLAVVSAASVMQQYNDHRSFRELLTCLADYRALKRGHELIVLELPRSVVRQNFGGGAAKFLYEEVGAQATLGTGVMAQELMALENIPEGTKFRPLLVLRRP